MTERADETGDGRGIRSGRAVATVGSELMETVTADLEQFIPFQINQEEYAVEILAVRELIAWTEVTRLPNMPAHLRGVLNLRGSIIPVFDLKSRFGMGETDVSETHVIVIVAVGMNILVGYTGQVSLGHAGFLAIGAYGTVLSMTALDLPFCVCNEGDQ